MKMKRSHATIYTAFALSLVLSLVVAAMISCGGSTTSSSNPTTGTVKTFLSDPPTCSLDFNHVWVTITKVEANISATSNSGWQTLVDLTANPKQVDLLSLNPSATPNFCGTLFLLGQKVLPPGKYQQIRLYLLSNNPSSPPTLVNKCQGAGWNCVDTGTDTKPILSELQLSSQAQTGIKITASQMSNGGLTVTAGQSTDFNIDFNTCASILKQGNGKYRFKPVLHGGEISTNGSNTISGKVVEGAGSPNPGMGVGGAIVLLEQPDNTAPTPTDRVIVSGIANSDGTFAFCPVPASTANYDVVVAGTTTQTVSNVTSKTAYNPSLVLGVPVGGSAGNIPVFPEAPSGGSSAPAMISGQITTQGGTPAASVGGDVQLSALQSVTNGANTLNVTVPVLLAASTPSGGLTDSQPPIYATDTAIPTPTSPGCATNKLGCVEYSVTVPASLVAVGDYDSTNGNNVTAPSPATPAKYTIEALADGSSNSALNYTLMTCSPTSVTSNTINISPGDTAAPAMGTGITVVDPSLVLGLTGCTQ